MIYWAWSTGSRNSNDATESQTFFFDDIAAPTFLFINIQGISRNNVAETHSHFWNIQVRMPLASKYHGFGRPSPFNKIKASISHTQKKSWISYLLQRSTNEQHKSPEKNRMSTKDRNTQWSYLGSSCHSYGVIITDEKSIFLDAGCQMQSS